VEWPHRGGATGDTVAAALYALGIRSLARSRKRHRPLGLSGSFLSGVLGRVNGRPNVRLDLEPVVPGLEACMQNTWPSPRLDLLALAQLLPSHWLRSGFEHTSLLPSGDWRFEAWERLLAFLAGMSPPPDARLPIAVRPGRRVSVDAVVVGGGPAGRAAANDAARTGARVTLVSRSALPGRYARALGISLPELDARVEVIGEADVVGLYREGALVVAAPHRHDEGAVILESKHVVLATGRRSLPPVVPGNDLPGVLDAYTAMILAHDHGVTPGRAVAVIGTGEEALVAERLKALGVAVAHVGPVAEVRRIVGRRGVSGIELDRTVACDALVHAGPWSADPGLQFQAEAEGLRQLLPGKGTERVAAVGAAAAPGEPPALAAAHIDEALVCSCMDVTAGEVLDGIRQGEADPEVLKRLTACGMGPCQGMPCWEALRALIARETGRKVEEIGRPSHRPPRRGLTVAQAAGLHGLVEPDR
jgi:NADPH-dependent 2,4-dienoyl-CoA reductase/sulfur reductase-like enzyme